jgi:hypothetical protein
VSTAADRPPALPLPVRRMSAVMLSACLLLLVFGARGLDGLRVVSGRLTGDSSLECGFRAKYGFDCLGCGGTRAFDRAARGSFGEAFRLNRLGAMTGIVTWLIAGGALLSLLSLRLRYLGAATAVGLVLLSGTMAVHAVLWWRALPPGFHQRSLR